MVGAPPPSLPSAEPFALDSASGTTVRGWFVPGAPGRGCVVLAHAVRGDRRGSLRRAKFLRDAGYGTLVYDAQAHGEALAAAAPSSELIAYRSGHNDCPPDWNAFAESVTAFLVCRGVVEDL